MVQPCSFLWLEKAEIMSLLLCEEESINSQCKPKRQGYKFNQFEGNVLNII